MKDQFAPEKATKRISRRKLLTFGGAMAALGVAGGFLYRHFSSISPIHAESYRQILGLQRWKDRGRLFVTGVHEYEAMKKDSALAVAEDMGRNA